MDIIAEESEMNTNGSEKRKEQVSHDQSCCISVIVPVYQAESYLPRCMESIRLQTWQTYEVILVDDGSLDAGGVLCDSYAQQDARIRVIHQENRGLSAARNAGIKKANGEWVAFVDADDAVAPSYLETLYQAAVMKHCDISQCGFEQFDKQLPESTVWDGSCCVFSGEEMQWRIYSSDRQIYLESTVSWNKLYHRDLFKDILFPEGKLHEDEALSYRLYAKAARIAVLPCALYWYYQNPTGIMGRKMNIRRLDYVEILYDRYRFYRRRKQDALAELTGKRLYTVLVDYASLKTWDVENYQQFRHRLQKLYRRCAEVCIQEVSGRKNRLRMRLGILNLCFLTVKVKHFPGRYNNGKEP